MQEEVNTQELMHQMGQTYGCFGSYQDEGYVQSIHAPGTADESHSQMTFSTLFRRPNLFRLEWQERVLPELSVRTSIIWCDGRKAYKKYGEAKVIGRKNLPLVISGATGVSRGIAHRVPILLMSDIGGSKLTEQPMETYVGTELISGEQCHHLRHDASHEMDLWISTSRLIVLKIFEQYIVGDGTDPSEWLRAQAFKSVSGLIRWLKMREFMARSIEREPFHVIEKTHYTNVILSAQIPIEAFTLQGLK